METGEEESRGTSWPRFIWKDRRQSMWKFHYFLTTHVNIRQDDISKSCYWYIKNFNIRWYDISILNRYFWYIKASLVSKWLNASWPTCRRPSRVLGMVTHLVGCAPLVVTAVIKLSSSSRFSFNFLTRLLIASFVNDSLSPPYTVISTEH